MEIRIDTTRDSKEEIRKAIRFLQELVEGAGSTQTQELPTGENVMGSIFDLPTANPEAGPQPEEAPKQKPREKARFGGMEVY